jgi:hypothetical protein
MTTPMTPVKAPTRAKWPAEEGEAGEDESAETGPEYVGRDGGDPHHHLRGGRECRRGSPAGRAEAQRGGCVAPARCHAPEVGDGRGRHLESG